VASTANKRATTATTTTGQTASDGRSTRTANGAHKAHGSTSNNKTPAGGPASRATMWPAGARSPQWSPPKAGAAGGVAPQQGKFSDPRNCGNGHYNGKTGWRAVSSIAGQGNESVFWGGKRGKEKWAQNETKRVGGGGRGKNKRRNRKELGRGLTRPPVRHERGGVWGKRARIRTPPIQPYPSYKYSGAWGGAQVE